MLIHKSLVAGIAVAVALLGVVAKMKWLTVAALVLWIVAMMILGTGKRQPKRGEPPSD